MERPGFSTFPSPYLFVSFVKNVPAFALDTRPGDHVLHGLLGASFHLWLRVALSLLIRPSECGLVRRFEIVLELSLLSEKDEQLTVIVVIPVGGEYETRDANFCAFADEQMTI
jgi:hypothetical protein